MKKVFRTCYFIILSFILFFTFNVNAVLDNSSYFKGYDYYFDSYHVDIIVNEDNTLKITEKIGAYFNVEKHGIFRKIPIENEIKRLDGTKSKNKVRIKDIYVNEKYSLSNDGNYKVIKIGDADKLIIGKKDYTISYIYELGKDTGKVYDELYYNIIGTEWDTYIENVTFKITMPKDFDKSKLGFALGRYGSTSSDKVIYNVDGNVISGSVNGVMEMHDGLTVRLELPEGYFNSSILKFDFLTILMIFIPIFGIIISFILWYKYGKDDEVVETVEFYPPNGLNSLDVAYLYKGYVGTKDVTSLLVYLANKGYLKISEEKEKGKGSKSKTFKIIKLKEYDGNNENERDFFEGLFEKGDVVGPDDLRDDFYLVVNLIDSNVCNKKNRNLIFVKNFLNMKIPVVLMMLLTLITIIGIPTYEYGGVDEVLSTFTMFLLFLPFYLVEIFMTVGFFSRISGLIFIVFSFIFIVLPTSFLDYLTGNVYYLLAFILGIISIIAMIVIIKIMPKRTKYGNEMLGKIKGFKRFLETAEKDRLQLLVMDDPTYFYDILPYAYVLGVSSKWIEKFESIAVEAPDWYDGNDYFSVSSFGDFVNSTFDQAYDMSTLVSSSSGGSSGGGSVGGGSGGGGGGSW